MMNKTSKLLKRKDFLPISRPKLGKQEIKEIIDTLRSGWITTGPKSFKFEDMFKKYVGARHAIALNSCTSALQLALSSTGVSEGDEVILSPFTFVSQANVIIHLGARPVFADIKEDTLNIDPESIKAKISDRTKAIMMTHFAGQPCERDRIIKIAKENKLTVIEDAAHALGSKWRGKRIGSDPKTISCFSFYPIKNITTAEGGMLTTGSLDIAERVRILSLHGLSSNAWKRYSSKGSWEYDVLRPGFKCNLPDLLAALGIAQMKRLPSFNERREKIAKIYIKGLSQVKGIRIPSIIKGVTHAWQIFPVMLTAGSNIDRDEMIERLKEWNIGTSVHFKPVHLFKFYRERFGHKEGDYPVSEEAYRNIFSIPIFADMQEKDANYVIDAIKLILDER